VSDDDFLNRWKEELNKQTENNFSKLLIEKSLINIDEIKKIVESGEISIIISFINLILLNKGKTQEEKEYTIKCVTHILMSSICLTIMPLTAIENIDKLYAKFREQLYHDILNSININIIAAKEALDNELGSEFVPTSTTVH
jgi:hypothetical protein